MDETKTLLSDFSFKVETSDKDFVSVIVTDYPFQNRNSLLKIDLYHEKIYKVSVHFTLDDNTAGMNAYFSMVDLIKDIYGDTKKIAIGKESDDYDHRPIQISIGSLTYQHRWESETGIIVAQLKSGSYGNFTCSLFYSSSDAKDIDDNKMKNEF